MSDFHAKTVHPELFTVVFLQEHLAAADRDWRHIQCAKVIWTLLKNTVHILQIGQK